MYLNTEEFLTCKILMLPSYLRVPYGWAFQKHSPYLQLFNYHLQIMDEIGTLQKLYQKYEAPPQVCPDKSGSSISFDSCLTAFLSLTGMYSIAHQ